MKYRMLSKVKGEHTYVFRYYQGGEDELIEHLMRCADDSESDFSWMDAADLCLRATNRAADDISLRGA